VAKVEEPLDSWLRQNPSESSTQSGDHRILSSGNISSPAVGEG
jgi:hypothetical protein